MEQVLTMREFFYNTLRDLEILAGLKQFHKLNELDNAQEEIKKLLDTLIWVCDQYPQIPNKDKQEIIYAGVVTDPEFFGFNAKIIGKWLFAVREKYNKRVEPQVEVNPEVDMTPLTGEARKKKIQEFLEALARIGNPVTEKADLYANVRTVKPVDGNTYTPTKTPEDLLMHDLHIQYVKENYDVQYGKPSPGWIPEDQWLEKQLNQSK